MTIYRFCSGGAFLPVLKHWPVLLGWATSGASGLFNGWLGARGVRGWLNGSKGGSLAISHAILANAPMQGTRRKQGSAGQDIYSLSFVMDETGTQRIYLYTQIAEE